MKSFISFICVNLMLLVMIVMALSAWDKTIFPGVDVVSQSDNVLSVELDEPLTLGTDAMCLEATYVLQQVALQSGCDIKVVSNNNSWVLFNGQVKSYSELTNIIESGSPY